MRLGLTWRMHAAGLRLDDAAIAADITVRRLREERNALILAARRAGLSYRRIARIVGLDHSRVIRVVTAAGGMSPPKRRNV